MNTNGQCLSCLLFHPRTDSYCLCCIVSFSIFSTLHYVMVLTDKSFDYNTETRLLHRFSSRMWFHLFHLLIIFWISCPLELHVSSSKRTWRLLFLHHWDCVKTDLFFCPFLLESTTICIHSSRQVLQSMWVMTFVLFPSPWLWNDRRTNWCTCRAYFMFSRVAEKENHCSHEIPIFIVFELMYLWIVLQAV